MSYAVCDACERCASFLGVCVLKVVTRRRQFQLSHRPHGGVVNGIFHNKNHAHILLTSLSLATSLSTSFGICTTTHRTAFVSI